MSTIGFGRMLAMFSASKGRVAGTAHSYCRAGALTLLLLLLLAYEGLAWLYFYCSRAHGPSQTQVLSRLKG